MSGCIGGDMLRRRRGRGVVDPFDETDGEITEAIPACNRSILKSENSG